MHTKPSNEMLRRSSTASSENSPTHHHTPVISSIDKVKRPIYQKLKTFSSSGEWIIPEKRHFHEDLNLIYSEDPSKLLGIFHTDYYWIGRKFIKTNRKEVQLYYTRIEPNHKIKGQIAIVHGFGEHSGRYLTVNSVIFMVFLQVFIFFFKDKFFNWTFFSEFLPFAMVFRAFL